MCSRRTPNWPIRCTSWVAIRTVTPTSLKAAEQVHHLAREVRVEVAGRLVGDQHRGLAHHGAGDAHALLLAGRELEREAGFLAQQADLVERRPDALVHLAARHAGDGQRQGDVVEHRAVGEQLVVLEHDADQAAEGRDLPPVTASC
jgi:hypothetical protein